MGKMNIQTKDVIRITAVGMLFIAVLFLFYQQACSDGTAYLSDLPAHIRSAVHGYGYSLMASLFRIAHRLYPHAASYAAVLAVITVLTVFASCYYMKVLAGQMGEKMECANFILISCGALFITSIYIPVLYPEFYNKGLSTQPWHNSTYLLMRFLGTLVMAVYVQLEQHYLSDLPIRQAALFTLLLTLANYAKPNFIIAFAPMMLLFLIRDFIRLRGKGVVPMIKFGSCVLLSLWVLRYQYWILYPRDGESGIAWTWEKMRLFLSAPQSVFKVIAGLAFPLIVLLLCAGKQKLPPALSKSWVLFLISWLEALVLIETGPRELHGNFGWGIKQGIFLLYLTSGAVLMMLYQKKEIGRTTYCLTWTAYLCSVFSGFYYFGKLLMGIGYGI